MKTTFVNPQWQGGADLVTYAGAMELKELYLGSCECALVPVELWTGKPLPKDNGIVGFEALKGQMGRASELLHRIGPDRVLAIGGGCDADVPVISYLNDRYGGDLAVVWLDAHGDLNSPEESSTQSSFLTRRCPSRAASPPRSSLLCSNRSRPRPWEWEFTNTHRQEKRSP